MIAGLRGLPITIRDALVVQVLLLIVCLFLLCFDTFYLFPKKQAAELDQFKNELLSQLPLITPLKQSKITQLLSTSTANNKIDWLCIQWQGQTWQYSNTQTGILLAQFSCNNTDTDTDTNQETLSSSGWLNTQANIYALDRNSASSSDTVLGSITLAKQPANRIDHLFAYLVALLTLCTSIVFTLSIYRRLNKESKYISQRLKHLANNDSETLLNHLDTTDGKALRNKENTLAAYNDATGNPQAFIFLSELDNSISQLEQYESQSLFGHAENKATQQQLLEQQLGKREIENSELSLAKQSAMEASRVKSKIIANTGHELLTPLNSIVGFSKILLDKKMDTGQQINFLQRINDNALHLSALVNDLLDFSVRSDLALQLDYQTVDIHSLLLSIANIMTYEAQSKGLILLTNFDTLLGCQIKTDPLRLRQVISNLSINAIRYTEQGHIKITAKLIEDIHGDKQLLLQIEDTGIGIAKEQQEDIFSTFVSHPSETVHTKAGPGLGLGLGLSIVATILNRLGAKLDLQSEIQQGSCFKITVPIKESSQTEPKININGINHIIILGDYLPAVTNLEQRLNAFNKNLHIETFSTATSPIENNSTSIAEHLENKTTSNALVIALINKQQVDEINRNEGMLYNSLINNPIAKILQAPMGLSINCDKLNGSLADNASCQIINGPFTIESLFKLSLNSANKLDLSENSQPINNSDKRLLKNKKTLVVDDNASNAELLSLLLTSFECRVDLASNGEDALVLVDQQQYDWLFLDIRMQPMDGISLIKNIRRRKSYQATPIIACTAHTSHEEFRKLADAGFNKVTYKPVKSEQLANLGELFFANNNSGTNEATNSTIMDQSLEIRANADSKKSGRTFDIETAIRKTAGNTKHARVIFIMLMDELKPAAALSKTLMDTLVNGGESRAENSDKYYQQLIDHIHKLHGSAAMTGANALQQQLNQCESFLKSQPVNFFDAQSIADIDFQLEEVNQKIKSLQQWYDDNDMDIIFEDSATL